MLKDDLCVAVRCSVTLLKGLLALCCLLVWVSEALAESSRYRGGLRNTLEGRRLSAKQLHEVAESLRAKTGWRELYFDEDGFLVCPEPNNFEGGSASARLLLSEAITSRRVFELEAYNRAAAVVFARLDVPVAYESRRTGMRIEAYPLQIDFADFNKLRGDGEALKAFDLGLVILHELGHGVWNLHDAKTADEEPGECEAYINRIRRELALPERQTYQAVVRPRTQPVTGGTNYLAELLFTRKVEKNGKTRQEQFFLQWEPSNTGQIPAQLGKQWPTITATSH
jgi:hypothetical protein